MIGYLWWLWDRLPDINFWFYLIDCRGAYSGSSSTGGIPLRQKSTEFRLTIYRHLLAFYQLHSFLLFYLTPFLSYTAYSPSVFGILQKVLEEVSLERIIGCSPCWNWWTVHHVGMSPRNTLPCLVKVESIQNWVSLRTGLGLHDVQTILCLSVLLWSVVPHLFTSILISNLLITHYKCRE